MANRFKVLFEKFGRQELFKITDTKTNEFVSILPETGGMLLDVAYNIGDKNFSVIDAYQTENELIENLAISFKGSNLFPFPNRIDGGKYIYHDIEHQLRVNLSNENNSIHGLIYDKKFELLEMFADNEQAGIKLQYDNRGDLPGYPWPFRFIIEYILNIDNGLTIKIQALNTSNAKIPVGIGYHPYFKLNSTVNDIYLDFPGKEIFKVNTRMLPTGETEIYNRFTKSKKIDDTEFDNCFGLDLSKNRAETTIYSENLKGGITIWQETGENKLNYLQIYTPLDRKSIAIEPMTCIANAFNNGIGLIEIEPKQHIGLKWGIKKIVSIPT